MLRCDFLNHSYIGMQSRYIDIYIYIHIYIYLYIFTLQRLKVGDLRRLEADEPSLSVKPSARS